MAVVELAVLLVVQHQAVGVAVSTTQKLFPKLAIQVALQDNWQVLHQGSIPYSATQS